MQLEQERRQVEVLAAREAKARRRAEKRATQPAPSGSGKSYLLVASAIAVAGIFAALGFYGTTVKAPSETDAIFQLKFDRDLQSFAKSLKESK